MTNYSDLQIHQGNCISTQSRLLYKNGEEQRRTSTANIVFLVIRSYTPNPFEEETTLVLTQQYQMSPSLGRTGWRNLYLQIRSIFSQFVPLPPVNPVIDRCKWAIKVIVLNLGAVLPGNNSSKLRDCHEGFSSLSQF